MKKIDYKLGIIIGLIGLSLFQYFNPTIKEVELIKEVEVEVVKTIIDSVYVDNIIEKKIYYPKEEITHVLKKGSSKSMKLFFRHTLSAIKYFLKW